MEKIKAFLSDPQVLFREGIHFTLSGEDDFEVTGETTNNEDALAAIKTNPPTVAILSMTDRKLDGPEATRRIKRVFPSIAVILIMEHESEEQLFLAIKCGASACLSKDTDPEYLVSVIREVAQGIKPLTQALLIPDVASSVIAEFKALAIISEKLNDMMAGLTGNEIELLNSIAAGHDIEQITASLSITEEVIRHRLETIVNKLAANDQAKNLIEATQRTMPSFIPGTAMGGMSASEFITREEFNDFKENLTDRLKSFIGELA
ncbi:response regulator [Chloroflexota bacterium]